MSDYRDIANNYYMSPTLCIPDIIMLRLLNTVVGKFGSPDPSQSSVTAMLLAIFTAMLFSIGGYFACARIAQVRSPPFYAINRGKRSFIR